MCGIVGGIAERNVQPILIEGLRKLEYRGYDSSGIALMDDDNATIQRVRSLGKIDQLERKVKQETTHFRGNVGIAHTRWATHGAPSEHNAHPHICNNKVAVVHNGIIENYQLLKQSQIETGYRFTSDTDTEVVAHAIHQQLTAAGDLLQAVRCASEMFVGAYALGVVATSDPHTLVVARKGSPLVIGVGIGEHFIASDIFAILPVVQRFIFLEDGDIAKLTRTTIEIYDADNQLVQREIKQSDADLTAVELGKHRHYMHKEIFDQPQAVADTLAGRVTRDKVLISSFGVNAKQVFSSINQVYIIACGTSYHAGLVAKYWMEDVIGVPCQVEVASEFRYRNPLIQDNTLFCAISQSGETADTLAVLQQIKTRRSVNNTPTLVICNVSTSSLVREADLVYLTHAGVEIGVASTKAFTTQLVLLALLITSIGKVKKSIDAKREKLIINGLHKLPKLIASVLTYENKIKALAQLFADKNHALFLGRGTMYPIALEGALKLKEISYIHAEAYPAGELKHGPLALIDEDMPVVAIAPLDDLLEKLKSNLQEVKARDGQMIIFEDKQSDLGSEAGFNVVKLTTNVGRITAPIVYNVALQLLAYHVALIKGTDIDQPRNLAKSVTVE